MLKVFLSFLKYNSCFKLYTSRRLFRFSIPIPVLESLESVSKQLFFKLNDRFWPFKFKSRIIKGLEVSPENLTAFSTKGKKNKGGISILSKLPS